MKHPRRKGIVRVWTAGILLAASAFGSKAAGSETVTVFAAASTTNALTEIGDLFAGSGPERFVPVFASSSTLAKQIENGAPADVFLSANPKWMDYLQERGMILPETRVDLLGNRIVLVVPADGTAGEVSIGPGFDLAGFLGSGGRLSTGDPDHVPAGIYGKQALEALGVWPAVEARLARAKDVRAALALVERGEAPAGVVYATDAAITHRVRVVGTFPEDSHPAIVYPAAVVAGKRSPGTERFMGLLHDPEARAIFEKHGFTVR